MLFYNIKDLLIITNLLLIFCATLLLFKFLIFMYNCSMYYNSLNKNLMSRFGCKVYKLALDGGMTCPNRDGTLGTRGCIFCLRGSGDFAAKASSVTEQIELAKSRVFAKIKSGKFIAYFQSYTNTYASVEYLEKIFTEAINHPDIAALSVATRPDCLEDEKIRLLQKLCDIKPVTVELGLQTIHESTAEYIRRGYPLSVYDKAVKRLSAAGIETVAHVILYLPGETERMMLDTVQYAADGGINGIKLQLLHILRGTDLEKDYSEGKIILPDMEQYISTLEKCIRILPPDIVIHRLTGDGAKRELIAPMWTADKKRVINAINAAFVRDNIIQGSDFE